MTSFDRTQRFVQILKDRYPALTSVDLQALISENLLSPHTVTLPPLVLEQAKTLVQKIFNLREEIAYLSFYKDSLDQKALVDPGNKAICMSYDFHWNPSEQKIKLIEINTNAAFLYLSDVLYEAAGLKTPLDFSISQMLDCVREEIFLHNPQKLKKTSPQLKLAIIDEKPSQQRLFVEFLMARELFRSQGLDCEIVEAENCKPRDFDFIYNRCTDFFFESPQLKELKEAFTSKVTAFSPNPFEYFLLADKERMMDWHSEEFWKKMREDGVKSVDECIKAVQDFVPRTQAFRQLSANEIWAQRKEYFFKPLRSFGSKQTFRGSSISRKAFDELLGGEFLRQEFVPASEVTFENQGEKENFKFDLRFYAYKDQIQSVVARLYQGQVTNLRTPNGGFAPVVWQSSETP